MTIPNDHPKNTSMNTTFLGIILGMFGISIMQLILATAMPIIVTEIGGDQLYGWVFSIYMLASLLTIPIFSKLADLYGKKKFYLLGMGIFALGTLYGGFALNMEHLLIARVIQGLGAGMMIPVSMAMISDLFPPERRGRMIGAFSAIQLLANLLSPVLGSTITRQLGWHWIFYITLVLIILAILLVARSQEPSGTIQKLQGSRVDILGGLFFGIFCVLIVSLSDSISNTGKFNTVGLFLLGGAIISAVILVLNERKHQDPVIKIAFFQNKILRRAILSALFAGAIMYGLVTLLPLCNTILGQSESQILMIFMMGLTFGMVVGSRMVGRFRASLQRILWGASAISSGVLYYVVSINHFLLFNIITCLLGLFLGGIMATLMINSQNEVKSDDRTVLSGLVQLGRYLGAALGVTILTGILPEISQISSAGEFLGSFSLLVGIYLLGFMNEII